MRFILSLFLLTLLVACQPSKRTDSPPLATLQEINERDIDQFFNNASKPYILLNFFASYCKPCLKEMPSLAKLNHQSDSKVHVIFITIDDTHEGWESRLANFLNKLDLEEDYFHFNPDAFEIFIDKVGAQWNRSLPVNLLFRKDGKYVTSLGITDQKEVNMIIRRDMHFEKPLTNVH